MSIVGFGLGKRLNQSGGARVVSGVITTVTPRVNTAAVAARGAGLTVTSRSFTAVAPPDTITIQMIPKDTVLVDQNQTDALPVPNRKQVI